MRAKMCVIACAVVMGFIANPAMAKVEGELGEGGPGQGPNIPDYKRIDPSLDRVSKRDLNPACPDSGFVAFSVTGTNHISQGAYTLLGYSITTTNAGGGWTPGGSTFIAPCAGLYVFTASLVKTYSASSGTTASDAYMYIYKNGVSQGVAWAGAAADVIRTGGSYTVSLLLNEGDYVQTFVYSGAAGSKRLLSRYDFTGYLVKAY